MIPRVKASKRTVLLVVSFLIALIDTAFVYNNHLTNKRALQESLQREGQQFRASLDTLLAQTYTNMLTIATFIASDRDVQQLFLQGKKAVEREGGGAGGEQADRLRKALYEKIGPNWQEVQGKFNARQLHFHLGPGSTSYLRVHKPGKYGDNMDNVRFTIVDTNAERTARTGFETGRVYSGLRGVVPVSAFDKGQNRTVHVGALEVGTSYKTVLDILDKRYGVGVGVLLTQDHIRSAMWDDYRDRRFGSGISSCNCVVEASSREGFDEILAKGWELTIHFREDGTEMIETSSGFYALNHIPIRDYIGSKDPSRDDVGAVVFWRPADAQMAAYRQTQRVNILFGVITYVVIELLLIVAFGVMTRHLEQLVRERTCELKESERRLTTAQQVAMIGGWEMDLTTDSLYLSDEIYRILGRNAETFESSYAGFLEVIHPGDRERIDRVYKESVTEKRPYAVDYRILTASGEEKYVREQGESLFDDEGNPRLSRGTLQDVTWRHNKEKELRLSASVFTHANEGILIADKTGIIVDVNQAFSRITGYSRDEVVGQSPSILGSGMQTEAFYKEMWEALLDSGEWQGEIWNRRKTGEVYAEMLTISSVRDSDGSLLNYVALFSDITERKQYQNTLEHMAHYDALTGLPNRKLLADRLHQAMSQAERRKEIIAVIYLDLDGFKAVNDGFGHQYGDKLLMDVSARMAAQLRSGDTLARIGGDEFVFVVTGLAAIEESTPLLERLLRVVAEPVWVEASELRVSASIGVAQYPQGQGVSADQLLEQADSMMYQAKMGGKNQYQLYTSAQVAPECTSS